MTIPNEFFALAQGFYSGSDREYADDYAWIDGVVVLCLGKNHAVVQAYLAELVSDKTDDTQLLDVWKQCDTDYWFQTPNDLRKFLHLVLEAVNRDASKRK